MKSKWVKELEKRIEELENGSEIFCSTNGQGVFGNPIYDTRPVNEAVNLILEHLELELFIEERIPRRTVLHSTKKPRK